MVTEYEIVNGVLTVYKELDYDYDVYFDKACCELVASPEMNLIIDLSHISHITSTYIGLMAAAFFQAQNDGKKISIRAEGSVLQILKRAGFENFIPLTDSRRMKAVKVDEPNPEQ